MRENGKEMSDFLCKHRVKLAPLQSSSLETGGLRGLPTDAEPNRHSGGGKRPPPLKRLNNLKVDDKYLRRSNAKSQKPDRSLKGTQVDHCPFENQTVSQFYIN